MGELLFDSMKGSSIQVVSVWVLTGYSSEYGRVMKAWSRLPDESELHIGRKQLRDMGCRKITYGRCQDGGITMMEDDNER